MRPVAAFLAVAGLAVLPSAVVAQNTTIHACANNNNGKLRVVADPSQCNAREGAIELAAPGGAATTEQRFQLVGYTVATTSGVMGGPWGANAKCQAEFPGSRMCVLPEATETVAPPAIRPPLAWVNPQAGTCCGRNTVTIGDFAYPCSGWTSLTPDTIVDLGSAVTEQALLGLPFCDAVLPIACCAPVP